MQCGKLSLSERDMEKEHHYQVKKRLKAKEQKDSPKKSKNKHKAMDASRTVVSWFAVAMESVDLIVVICAMYNYYAFRGAFERGVLELVMC